MKTLFVWGWYGAGKSTLITTLKNNLPHLWHFYVGNKLTQIWQQEGLITDPQELAILPKYQKQYLEEYVGWELHDCLTTNKYDTLIVDSHYSIYDHGDMKTNTAFLDRVSYDGYMLVKTPVPLILSRIMKDSKKRLLEMFEEKNLNNSHNSEYATFEKLRSQTDAKSVVVSCEHLEDATLKAIEFIHSL